MKEATLGRILREIYESAPTGDKVANIHLFGIYYSDKIENEKLNKKEILIAAGLPASYHTEMSKGMRLKQYVEVNKIQAQRIEEIQKRFM